MGVDHTGKMFSRLTAVEKISNYNGGSRSAYRCTCMCGDEAIVLSNNLVSGHIKSCGCLRRDNTRAKSTKHGLYNSPLYPIWRNMKSRCYNKNHKFYKDYGGRNISVCDEWKDSPYKFINWANSNCYKNGLQIDRIDNGKNYSPSNCRFVPPKINGRNKRNNVFFKYKLESKCIAEWAELYSLKYNILYLRLMKYKWPIGKALTTPVREFRNKDS